MVLFCFLLISRVRKSHLMRALLSWLGWLSNSTGPSDDDWKAHRIAWILFLFDHIWVFVQGTPSSRDVSVLLLNQPIISLSERRRASPTFSYRSPFSPGFEHCTVQGCFTVYLHCVKLVVLWINSDTSTQYFT